MKTLLFWLNILLASLAHRSAHGLNSRVEIQGYSAWYPIMRAGLSAHARVSVNYFVESELIESRTERAIRPNVQTFFVLVNEEQSQDFYLKLPQDTPDSVLCTAPSVLREEIVMSEGRAESNFTFTVRDTDRYTLFFAYCGASDGNTPIPVAGHFSSSFVNVDADGRHSLHLPFEYAPLPALYRTLIFAYGLPLLFWVCELREQWSFVKPVHSGALLAWAFKCLSIVAHAVYYGSLNETGRNDPSLKFFATLSGALGDAFFMSLLLAVSLESANPEGIFLTLTSLAVYIVLAIMRTHCERDEDNYFSEFYGEGGLVTKCQSVSLGEYIVRSLIMLGIIVSLNYYLTKGRERLLNVVPPVTTDVAVSYSKLRQMQALRIGFLVYLFSPTIQVILEAVVLDSWEYAWLTTFLLHLFFLLIFLYIGVVFSPSSTHSLTRPFPVS